MDFNLSTSDMFRKQYHLQMHRTYLRHFKTHNDWELLLLDVRNVSREGEVKSYSQHSNLITFIVEHREAVDTCIGARF